MSYQATSAEAFASIAHDITAMQARVYRCILKDGPLTDEELFRLSGLAPNTARPRRIELVAKGLVRSVEGRRGITSTGRSALLWEVAK